MPKADYVVFEALNPFFEIIQKGLSGLVDGEHYFDTIADDAFFEFRYHFPGWPLTIRGRANLIAMLLRIRQDDQASLRRRTCCAPLSGQSRRDPRIRSARQILSTGVSL